MAKRAKVALVYPSGGSVTVPFHHSLLKIYQYENEKRYQALVGMLVAATRSGKAIRYREAIGMIQASDVRSLAEIGHVVGLYIADNRSYLTERFFKMEPENRPDWLLQIDTDIEFPKDLLETMLALAGEDKKVLAASVPLGQYATCAFMRTEVPGFFVAVPVSRQPIECDAVATAVILIHRDVLEAIAARHGQCWFNHMYLPKSPEGTPLRDFEYLSQGEDIAFCGRAREAGFKIWCAHVPGLGHYKTRRLSHDDERAAAMASMESGMGEIVKEGEECAPGIA